MRNKHGNDKQPPKTNKPKTVQQLRQEYKQDQYNWIT